MCLYPRSIGSWHAGSRGSLIHSVLGVTQSQPWRPRIVAAAAALPRRDGVGLQPSTQVTRRDSRTVEDLNSGVIHLNELGHLKVEQGLTCSLKKTAQGGRRPAAARAQNTGATDTGPGVQAWRGVTPL